MSIIPKEVIKEFIKNEKFSSTSDGMEEKILSVYAVGMSTRDMSEQVKNLYDIEISSELVSKISEKSCHNSMNGRIDR